MISEKDIRSLVEEWFTDLTTPVEVTELYALLICTIKNQMRQRFEELKEED
jgi:hypothetical protein